MVLSPAGNAGTMEDDGGVTFSADSESNQGSMVVPVVVLTVE